MSACLQVDRSGGVLRLTLNRPEQRNALSAELSHALIDALLEAQTDDRVGAVLLRGAGEAFSAGLDLHEAARGGESADVHGQLLTIGPSLRKPLVAAVHGNALGGGLGLALNAHFVLAAADARLGATEVHLGLWPYFIYDVLRCAVGERRAVQLALAGRVLDSGEAQALGLVDAICPNDALARESFELASRLATLCPTAVRAGLEFVQGVRLLPKQEFLAFAIRSRDAAASSRDFKEGIRAFLEKRRPHWTNQGLM